MELHPRLQVSLQIRTGIACLPGMGNALFGSSTSDPLWRPEGLLGREEGGLPLLPTFHFSPPNPMLGPACEACRPYFSEQRVPWKKAEDVVGSLSSSVPQASWVPSVGWWQKHCRTVASSRPVSGVDVVEGHPEAHSIWSHHEVVVGAVFLEARLLADTGDAEKPVFGSLLWFGC